MKKTIISLCLTVFAVGLSAQSHSLEGSDHGHTNHMVFGTGIYHIKNENVWVPGLHIHYGKALGKNQKFSVGTGFELLLDDHRHSSIALNIEYALTPSISLGYGPGINFPLASDAEKDMHFSQHFEIAYEFDLDFIHLGPMIEYAYSKEDQHFMLGVIVGIGF